MSKNTSSKKKTKKTASTLSNSSDENNDNSEEIIDNPDGKIIKGEIELWTDDDFINNDFTNYEISESESSLWTEKYRPKSLTDYFIPKEQLKIAETWIKNFLRGKLESFHPFLVLYGTPGVGKTTLAYLLMKKYNLDIIEINASDVRNKKQVKELVGKIGPYSVSNLGKNRKIVGLIMDEIDGMLGGDNGGISELINILIPNYIQSASNLKSAKVKENIKYKFPVIATCNSIKDSKLQPILKYSLVMKITPPSKKYLSSLIHKIADSEQFSISEEKINQLINENMLDYRQVINELYQYYMGLRVKENLKNQSSEKLQEVNFNDETDNVIKISGDTVVERIQHILIHVNYEKLVKEFKFADSNLYSMCLYHNLIPVLGKSQYLKKRIQKTEYLEDLHELIDLYDNINLIDLMNEKIHDFQNWDLNGYIEYIGIINVLNKFREKNNKLFDWDLLTHHHNHNIMRQEQSNHRKLFNSFENGNHLTNPVKLYYQSKLENHSWNEKIIEQEIGSSGKKKVNPYEKVLEKFNNIMEITMSNN